MMPTKAQSPFESSPAAVRRLRPKGHPEGESWEIILPLPPVPKASIRHYKGRRFYPYRYMSWRKAAGECFAGLDKILPRRRRICIVDLVSYKEGSPSAKRPIPTGDVDNFMKAALDALVYSGVGLADDYWVQKGSTEKFFAGDTAAPHQRITITWP